MTICRWKGNNYFHHRNASQLLSLYFLHPQRFGTNRSQSIQTDFIDYLDELAAALGSKPDLLSLLLWDPILAWAMFFGPCNPFQFRLKGPGKWTGARDAILTQRERIIKPTKTRVVSSSSNHTLFSLLTAIGLLGILAAFFLFLVQH